MNSLYYWFIEIVKQFGNKTAINGLTYSDVLNIVNLKPYSPICEYSDYKVLIDILVAAKHNKPLIIPPKNKTDYNIPNRIPKEFSLILYSSGSTSLRKPIFIPESMILENAKIAIEIQKITSEDTIYNVCSMNHTGGLNAQVIPGLLSGATLVIEEFDPFKFNKRIEETESTLVHLVPKMLQSLRKVEKHKLRFVAAGSDCMYREYVEKYLNVGVPFMINYGMSEAGPIIINHIFNSIDELSVFDNGIPLGNNVTCEYKIENKELLLKGNNTNTSDWLATGDCVTQIEDWIYYNGRKSAGCQIVKKRY
jgi:acyl-CoA synthetase (AMP-forming)/AMP-acid ligase II